MDIYVKPNKKTLVKGKKTVSIRDIAEVHAPDDIKEDILGTQILEIKEDIDKTYLISITQIISIILKKYPNAAINNVGEIDSIIEYEKAKPQSRLLGFAKMIFVCVVLFTGAATAIMSYYSDAQIYKIFEKFTKLFLGKNGDIRYIQISYSIGLAVGITVFFNHFAGKRITKDPTPIEVEMSIYEQDVCDTMIDTLNKKKG